MGVGGEGGGGVRGGGVETYFYELLMALYFFLRNHNLSTFFNKN